MHYYMVSFILLFTFSAVSSLLSITLSEQTCDSIWCALIFFSLLAALMGLQRITESLSLTQSKTSPLPHWSPDNENTDLYDHSQWEEDSKVHQILHLSSCAKGKNYIYSLYKLYIYYNIHGIFVWLVLSWLKLPKSVRFCVCT